MDREAGADVELHSRSCVTASLRSDVYDPNRAGPPTGAIELLAVRRAVSELEE